MPIKMGSARGRDVWLGANRRSRRRAACHHVVPASGQSITIRPNLGVALLGQRISAIQRRVAGHPRVGQRLSGLFLVVATVSSQTRALMLPLCLKRPPQRQVCSMACRATQTG